MSWSGNLNIIQEEKCSTSVEVVQRCMSFTEKIVVGQISGKVMHSGKVMYMSFTEDSFKVMNLS